jgi:NADH dehydrogenase
MKIFIAGIGGFLGRALEGRLAADGHSVSGSRRAQMALGKPFDPSVFAGSDCVIYCAHEFAPGAQQTNVQGTRAWLHAAQASGAGQHVFLSSYSALPDAESEYGRTKYEIEQMFLDSGHTVLRPGLVMGDGGLFQRQRAALLRLPIVPMIGGGNQRLATIRLQDFLEAAVVVIESGRTGAFTLFEEPQPTYREFVGDIKKAAGQPVRVISVPVSLALAFAGFAAALRLPVPVRPGQIRALLKNSVAAWPSDLPALLAERR